MPFSGTLSKRLVSTTQRDDNRTTHNTREGLRKTFYFCCNNYSLELARGCATADIVSLPIDAMYHSIKEFMPHKSGVEEVGEHSIFVTTHIHKFKKNILYLYFYPA